ncbi:MAG: hypothetical protein GY944_04695 [bacterium]|nr:hypothetical protein [bacterium]
MRWAAALLAALFLVLALPAVADLVERSVSRGPVDVTLRLEPSEPLIGDPIHLEIEVLADDGVEVLMPEFGEALDRFLILDFAPSEEVAEGGRNRHLQRYNLEPPRSGEHSIPPLLVEFVDRRPGSKAAPDGADAYEVLTERVDFSVQSVLPEGASDALRSMPGRLSPLGVAGVPYWVIATVAIVVLVAGAPLFYRFWSAREVARRKRSAYEVARIELDALLQWESHPTGDRVEAFYVKLSGIIRQYLEDRFELRSPELTTEEFLVVASRSPDLNADLRSRLGDFLKGADLVKFAGLVPGPSEIDASVEAARRFLEETRTPDDPREGPGYGEGAP